MKITPTTLHYRSFLALDAFFEGGRMLVGAISVAYLLASGLSLNQVATLKTIQAVVVFIGNVPTGAIADTLGRRWSLLFSAALGLFGFTLYFIGGGFPIFILAEIFTALSLCFWSGAFEAYAIDQAALTKESGLLDNFFHLNQSLNSLAVMVFGFIGGMIALRGLHFPYFAAGFSFGLLIFGILFFFPNDPPLHTGVITMRAWASQLGRHVRSSFSEGILHPVLLPIFVASILVQFSIQPILHYWQPFFQTIDGGVSSAGLGTVFSAYAAASAALGYIYSRCARNPAARSPLASVFLFLSFSGLYLIMPYCRTWLYAVITFCLLQGVLSVARTSLTVRLNEVISNSSRASILSSLGLFSRAGTLASLFMVPFLLGKNATDVAGVQQLFKVYSWTSLLVSVPLIAFVWMRKRSPAYE